ncbi:MAG: winged helix-turn-helix transcriptional regulator [Acidimicrobiia bacterium]|nr:winged helix-turn-helix transcriptional regulator [Acidimicrobiia bacterium]
MKDAPCACSRFRRATRALTRLYDEALAAAGLRVTQFSVLRALERAGRPLSISDLAATVALDRSTVGRNLDVLQRLGLIGLAPDAEDGRASVVVLTEAGRAAIVRALPHWRKVQGEVRRLFGAARMDRLIGQIDDLVRRASP